VCVVVLAASCDRNPGQPFCLLQSTTRNDRLISVVAKVDMARNIEHLLSLGLQVGFYRETANATYRLPVAFLFVCLSVRLSDACIGTKRNDLLPKFLYHIKGPLI